jgi:hypothetical protein
MTSVPDADALRTSPPSRDTISLCSHDHSPLRRGGVRPAIPRILTSHARGAFRPGKLRGNISLRHLSWHAWRSRPLSAAGGARASPRYHPRQGEPGGACAPGSAASQAARGECHPARQQRVRPEPADRRAPAHRAPGAARGPAVQRLESADEPLVLLVAPSGFGKTRAVSAAAGQGPLFPMLTELPIQEAGAHLLAGDLPAAAAALQHGTAPLSAPIWMSSGHPSLRPGWHSCTATLVSAEAALDRAAGAAAEHSAVAQGVGQIIADLAGAGIHLQRREHEPAASLLTAARAAARINGRPTLQAMVDTWIARLATAQGDRGGRAGVFGLGAPGPHRARRQGPGTVRARGIPHHTRLAPAEASALIPQLPPTPPPGCSSPGCTSSGGSGRRPSRPWRQLSLALSASGWNGGSSEAWQPRHPT